ncbi:14620_t:CDS:2, partial [Dentiscutata erythropus]
MSQSEEAQKEPSLIESFKRIIFHSISNILLFFVPLGYIVHFLNSNAILIFIMNFLVIIPSAKLVKFANSELSRHFGQFLGSLLGITLDNLVELIITIIALVNGQIRVVQAAVLGSIYSHILLVLGLCFLFGGIKILRDPNKLNKELEYNSTIAQMTSSVLTLACISLVIPAAFSLLIGGNYNLTSVPADKIDVNILRISYGTSIVLLVIYLLFLWFKIKTHKKLFDKLPKNEGDKKHKEHINLIASLVLLIVMTVIITFSARFLVESIDGIVESHNISKTFIGLILLPIVGHGAK